MRRLYLFVTQAEGGAPGYLSALGERAMENTIENLKGFLGGLGLDFEVSRVEREAQLSNASAVSAVGEPGQQAAAVKFSLSVFGDVLLISGEHIRSMKTAEGISQEFVLPVVVDRRADRNRDSQPSVGTLADVLSDLEENWLSAHSQEEGKSESPRLVLVLTSLETLGQWLETILPTDRLQPAVEALQEASEGDSVPAVFVVGREQAGWVID